MPEKWKRLRVMVEVKVPPKSPLTEKDIATDFKRLLSSDQYDVDWAHKNIFNYPSKPNITQYNRKRPHLPNDYADTSQIP